MLRTHTLTGATLTVVAALLWASAAEADGFTPGSSCTSTPMATSASVFSYGGNNELCNGSTWQFPAYQFGGSALSCTSTNAGIIQYTGGVYEGCNGSTWVTLLNSNSNPISSLTAAIGSNTFDSGNYAQTWQWGTLTTQTALSLTTSSMTSGTLLSLQNTAVAATATGYLLSLSNATTGKGYAVYSAMTGTGNTGYAGYFSNSATAGWGVYSAGSSPDDFTGTVAIGGTTTAAYPLYVLNSSAGISSSFDGGAAATTFYIGNNAFSPSTSSPGIRATTTSVILNAPKNSTLYFNRDTSGSNVYFQNGSSTYLMAITTASGVGIGTTSPAGQLDVESTQTYAGYFHNTATTSAYGVYSASASTTTGAAVYGTITGAANTGFAAYFANTATSGTNYAVYASNGAPNGYAVYASNTNSSGVALWCSSSYGNGGCGGSEAWTNSSDLRLKDAVTDLPAARGLNAVLKLRPVTYRWKDKTHGQNQHIGLIAQEVEPLYPEVVGTGPDGMKSLAYSDLVVPLIKAVQERQAQIEKHRREIAELRKEIADLKALSSSSRSAHAPL